VLQLEGFTSIEMRGAFQTDDYISDGILFGETGIEINGWTYPRSADRGEAPGIVVCGLRCRGSFLDANGKLRVGRVSWNL